MHLGGQASWVYAIGALPLATVFAIEFTAPIWTAVLAVLFLGEHMNRGRAVMLALGLAGRAGDPAPGPGRVPAGGAGDAGRIAVLRHPVHRHQEALGDRVAAGGAVLDVGDPDAGLPGSPRCRAGRCRWPGTCRGSC